MKSLLLCLGLALTTVMGYSDFAENRFRDIQMRLHRQYGHGLRNLADSMSGGQYGVRGASPSPDNDPATGGKQAVDIVVNDQTIHTKSWKSFFLGAVVGLQYNDNTFGKCFYAMVDTVNFYDYFVADANALITDGNFYNLFVYEPTRFTSNLAALFELCNANRLMDMAGQFANLDPSYISETLTRQIMVSLGSGSSLLEDVMFYANLNEDSVADLNYWQAGLSAGKLMKALLDFNINN